MQSTPKKASKMPARVDASKDKAVNVRVVVRCRYLAPPAVVTLSSAFCFNR